MVSLRFAKVLPDTCPLILPTIHLALKLVTTLLTDTYPVILQTIPVFVSHAASMAIPDNPRPRLTGVRYLGEALVWSAVFEFRFNGVRFSVVAASPGNDASGYALVPPGYRFDESIEGKFLAGVTNLAWGEFDKKRDDASERLELQLADMAADACLTAMQQLAPSPLPAAQTLQDHLYPQTYTLQVFTEGGRLTCRVLDGYTGIPERHPPVSEDKLHAMKLALETTDIPIVEASQVILVRRCGLAWRVTVNGEDMVCKSSIDVFEDAVRDELEIYLKLRSAKLPGLRIPELKGGSGQDPDARLQRGRY